MAETDKTLTTGEFSQITGIAVSTITQMLRLNKIRGEKRGRKWAICESELQHAAVVTQEDRRGISASVNPNLDTPTAAQKAYDVETFVQMTYLTEKGVRQWLKSGRLSGRNGADGKVLVDTANLDRPELQHLIRKKVDQLPGIWPSFDIEAPHSLRSSGGLADKKVKPPRRNRREGLMVKAGSILTKIELYYSGVDRYSYFSKGS